MSRNEMYPWSLLTEVGDYFCVMAETKAYVYMNQLVTQRNYRLAGSTKCVATKTSYGTIVMLVQIDEEIPPHEFASPSGILSSTSRRHLIESRSQEPTSRLGEKAIVPKRTQGQIIAAMHWEVRNANLPWWYDPNKGTLVVNPSLIKEPESEMFFRKQFNPGAETPYPAHYNLGENLLIRDAMEDEDEDDEGVPMILTGDDDVDLDDNR